MNYKLYSISEENEINNSFYKTDMSIVNYVKNNNNDDDLYIILNIYKNEIDKIINAINNMYILNGHTIYIQNIKVPYVTIQKEYKKLLYLDYKYNLNIKYKFNVSLSGFRAYWYAKSTINFIDKIRNYNDIYTLFDYNKPMYICNKIKKDNSVCVLPIYIKKYFGFIKNENIYVQTEEYGTLDISI